MSPTFTRAMTRYLSFIAAVGITSVAAQSSFIQRVVGAGNSPTTYYTSDKLFSVTELQTDPGSRLRVETSNEGLAYSIGREASALVKRRTSLADGIEMSTRSIVGIGAEDAVLIPNITTLGQTPVSDAYVLVEKERVDVRAADANASTARLRINAEIALTGNGLRSVNRSWTPIGRASLLVSGTIFRRSGNLRISSFSTAFAIEWRINSTGPTATVSRIFGQGDLGTVSTPDFPGVGVAGGSGAWDSLSNDNGTGYIDLNVPNGSYVEYSVTCRTTAEVLDFSRIESVAGAALVTYDISATGRVWATMPEGGNVSSLLGTALRSQNVGVGVADRPLTSPAFDLPATSFFFNHPISYTLLRGPASLNGISLTPTGTRGLVELLATVNSAPNDFHPASAPISFRLTGLSQTLDFPAISNRFTNSPAFIPSATASSGLPVTFTILSGPASTADGRTITLTGAPGTVRLLGQQLGDDLTEPTLAIERSFNVATAAPTTQTINFPSLINAEVGAGQLVIVSASSGLPVTLTVTAGSATFAGINKNILIANAPGVITIQATQPGGLNNGITYAAASAVTRSFTATAVTTPLETFLTNAGVPTGQRGADADPDRDGIPNVLEYALGRQPLIADANSLTLVKTVGGNLTLTYTQAEPSNVNYEVQTSADLSQATSWTATGVNQGTPDQNGMTVAAISIDSSVRFIRLKVTTSP